MAEILEGIKGLDWKLILGPVASGWVMLYSQNAFFNNSKKLDQTYLHSLKGGFWFTIFIVSILIAFLMLRSAVTQGAIMETSLSVITFFMVVVWSTRKNIL